MKKRNPEEKKVENEAKEQTGEELLKEYFDQDDDRHFTHIDGYYSDHSDSGCC